MDPHKGMKLHLLPFNIGISGEILWIREGVLQSSMTIEHIIIQESMKMTVDMISRGIHLNPGSIMTTIGILHQHRNETFRERTGEFRLAHQVVGLPCN